MSLILTSDEKLQVLRGRLANLRIMYADNELSLDLLNLDPEAEANEQVSQQQSAIAKQQEAIARNVAYINAQIEALEETRLDDMLDAQRPRLKANGKK